MLFRCYGEILSLLAAAACALGVADVTITMSIYCNSDNWDADWCSTTQEPYVWVWVASGIWASLPIFLTGLYSLCVGTEPVKWRYFTLMVFLSTIVFAPAIIILSAIELWRGSTSEYTFYMFDDSNNLAPGSIASPNPNPYQAKFAIPLAIAILGGVMFLMTGYVTLFVCCCRQSLISAAPVVTNTRIVEPCPQNVVTKQIVYEQRPQIRTTYVDSQSPCDPCSRFASLPYLPTRYNSVPVYGSGGFSNFQSGPGNAVYFSR